MPEPVKQLLIERDGLVDGYSHVVAELDAVIDFVDEQGGLIGALIERLSEAKLLDEMDQVQFNQWSQSWQKVQESRDRRLCTYGPPEERSPRWALMFEDPDKGIMWFDDEAEAQWEWDKAKDHWTCTLLVTATVKRMPRPKTAARDDGGLRPDAARMLGFDAMCRCGHDEGSHNPLGVCAVLDCTCTSFEGAAKTKNAPPDPHRPGGG